MKFTILVIPHLSARGERVPLPGSDPARFQLLMDRLREQMQFAEGLGYSGFCMTEQHMQIEGIETTTNPLFWDYFVAQHTKSMRVGQLGMNLTGVAVDDPDVNFYENYYSTSERNYTGYKNPEVDKMIDQQSAETDVDKRKQIVWAIEKKLAEDVARPPIGYNVDNTCWDPKVKGIVLQVNSIYNGWRFEDAWLDK